MMSTEKAEGLRRGW